MKTDDSQTNSALLAYAAPACITFFLLNPTWSVLPGIYAKYFGLPLTTIAMVAFYSRIFDAVSDPVIGYLSDRHCAFGGSRKIWVIVGSLLFLVSAYFLFNPPQAVSASYYLVFSMMFYLSLTIVDVPHAAWGGEIIHDYSQRGKLYSYRVAAMNIGQIAFFALPLLPFFSTQQYTPETLSAATFAAIVFALPILAFTACRAPKGTQVAAGNSDSFADIIQSIVANRPLVLFLAAYLCSGISVGMWSGLMFIFLDSYLALGDKVAIILFTGNVAGLVSIPVWLMVLKKAGKALTWSLGTVFFVLLLMVNGFFTPQTHWYFPLIFSAGAYIGLACLNIIVPSMIADIADYGVLKFYKDRRATYFALLLLSFKVTMGAGSAISLWIIGTAGFSMTATSHSSAAVFSLKLAFVVLPIVFSMIAIGLVLLTPISQHRHAVIMRRLESRNRRTRLPNS